MKHQIGLCAAPCAGLQSREEYLQTFDNIRRILRGDFDDILASLKAEMLALADELRFEEAEAVKRRIRLLEEYQSRSTVVGANVRDVDVVSILSDERYAWVNFMRIRNGAIIYSFSNEVRKQLDETDAELLAILIPQFHQQTQSTATEVVLPIAVPDLPPDYLQQNIAPRGDRRRLLELSLRNVEAYRKQCTHQRALTVGEAAPQALKQLERLQALLSLPKPPMEIECFDNSNIQGAYPVAGMVRFSAGKPNRKEYRKFNIKGKANLQPPTSDLQPPTSDLQPPTSDLRPPTSDLRQKCYDAMNDDFATPTVISHLFDAARIINSAADGKLKLSQADIDELRWVFDTFLFGILGMRDEAASGANTGLIDSLMHIILDIRATAKQNKDWATSDRIRDALAAAGVTVKDGKDGATYQF